jgi:hypothetical protein
MNNRGKAVRRAILSLAVFLLGATGLARPVIAFRQLPAKLMSLGCLDTGRCVVFPSQSGIP